MEEINPKNKNSEISNFTNYSSLDPIPRIIQKGDIKIFDVDKINTNSKSKNQIALESFRNEIRREYLKNFNEIITIEKWVDPVDDLNKLLIDFALKSFKKYIFDQEEFNRYIYAENIGEDKILIELDNRYCKSYQDKINRRAKYIGWKYRKSRSVLLTLTIDPSKYNDDKYLMWLDIKKQLNRFLTNVKYYFKKENRVFPPYICSIEAQKNGNPHLHICFLGASRLLDWRKIRDIWHLGHIFINRDSNNRKVRNPVNYLMKYISKTYTDTNDKNELTQSLCWLFNIRSYQCSRGLIIPLKPKKPDSEYYSEYLIFVNDSIPLMYLYDNIDRIHELSYPSRFYLDGILKGG
jgi:hypothetical protein